MKTKKIKNRFNKGVAFLNDRWWKLSIFVGSLFYNALSFADEPSIDGSHDLGTVAQKINGELQSFKAMAWTGSQVIGIVICLVSGKTFWKITHGHEGRVSKSQAGIAFIVGTVMFFLPTFMGVGAASLLGD